jgi:hypothetical protein
MMITGMSKAGTPHAEQPLPPAHQRRAEQVVAPDGGHMVHQAEGEAHEDAGHHAGDEQPRHRHLTVGDGIDHHDDAGWDDGPDGGVRAGQGRGVILVVAGLLHHAHDQGAGARGIGQRGAADPGKDHLRQDVDVPEAAPDVADQVVGEAEQGHSDAACAHEIGGQDEEGDRHQREGVNSVEEPLGHGEEGELAVHQEGQKPRPTHADGDGKPDGHAEEKGDAKGDSHGSDLLPGKIL